MKKSFISILLSIIIALCVILPFTAFAAEGAAGRGSTLISTPAFS